MLPRGIARKIFLGYVLPLIVLLVAGFLVPVFLWAYAGRYRGEFTARKELASQVEVLVHAAEDVAEFEWSLRRFKDQSFLDSQSQSRFIYRAHYQEIVSWFEEHQAPELSAQLARAHQAFVGWDRKRFRTERGFTAVRAQLKRLSQQVVEERDRYEPVYLLADTIRITGLVLFPFGALLWALQIGRSIARSITEPMEALVATLGRLERQEISPEELPDESGRQDEVGELWQALRRMAETVAERESALEARSEALATAGRRLESVLDTTNDGIALLSREGRFLLVNPRFAGLFGLEAQDLLGQSFAYMGPRLLSFFKSSDRVAARQRLRAVLRDTEHVAEETFALARPFPRVLRLYSAPVRTEGTLIGRIVVLRDVTRETEADRVKSEFAATVSHELRTPLTAIHGNVALLLSEKPGPLTDDQREFLSLTQSSVQRLTELINDMLDLSRLESVGLQMAKEAVDCASVARPLVRLLEEQARSRGVELAVVVPEGLPLVQGDRDRIAQVLTNLISNALKYTPAGGRVIVRLAAEPHQLVVRVIDTGIGLTADDRAQLFVKFFRADNSTTRSVGGTGLGLTISKAIVERLGGRIWVESTPGIGSTFAFTLPLWDDRAPEPVAPVVATKAPLGPRRLLLLVHDQTSILHRLNHALSRQGMILSAAAVAVEAQRRARDLRPDAVLLTPFTTAFDAFQLLRGLRNDSGTERMTVLLYALQALGSTYELQDTLALTSPERLGSVLARLPTDEPARIRPVVVVGEKEFWESVQEHWSRQNHSPLLWCRSAEELSNRVGSLIPLTVVFDTQNQDTRALGGFARRLLERPGVPRTVWVFVGDFGTRTRLLVPTGAGTVPLERAATTLQEAIEASH